MPMLSIQGRHQRTDGQHRLGTHQPRRFANVPSPRFSPPTPYENRTALKTRYQTSPTLEHQCRSVQRRIKGS